MAKTTTGQHESSGCASSLLAVGCLAMLGLALLIIPFAFIGHGIYEAVIQDRLIRAARPVAATVVSSRVTESRGRRGRRNEVPIIVFRYQVDGRTYQSGHSMILAARGRPDGMTVDQFVAAHPPGATVEAYYVPDQPWRAFLLKKYNEGPYVSIYGGLGFLALILSSGIAYVFVPTNKAPMVAGWHALVVRRPLRARVRVNLVQGIVYLSIWGWTAWHYFARVPPPHGLASHVFTWGVAIPGLWYVVAGTRAHFTRRAVSDARVAVSTQQLRIGDEAHVRVEQDMLGNVVLERVRVGLVCEKTTGSGKHKKTEVHWQAWASPEAPVRRPRGDDRRISVTESVIIPPDLPASQSNDDPRYKWKLVVETALAGCPDYRDEFEVDVRPAEGADCKQSDTQ